MNTTTAPSLLDSPLHAAGRATTLEAPVTPHSLLDLMYDGFYALFLMKKGAAPSSEPEFSAKMQAFLADVERQAKKLDASADDIYAVKYAFCAAVDEIILRSQFPIRAAWERCPLQLTLFGDQLAGENFFDKLETLRTQGGARLQALEVFHMCLLMGFQGKYALEGPEKLNYLIGRLGDELAHMKGRRAGFAPHWERPDAIANKLRNDVPLWIIGTVFALVALLGYIGLNWNLSRFTAASVSSYTDIVRLAPKPANLTITLP